MHKKQDQIINEYIFLKSPDIPQIPSSKISSKISSSSSKSEDDDQLHLQYVQKRSNYPKPELFVSNGEFKGYVVWRLPEGAENLIEADWEWRCKKCNITYEASPNFPCKDCHNPNFKTKLKEPSIFYDVTNKKAKGRVYKYYYLLVPQSKRGVTIVWPNWLWLESNYKNRRFTGISEIMSKDKKLMDRHKKSRSRNLERRKKLKAQKTKHPRKKREKRGSYKLVNDQNEDELYMEENDQI